MIRGGGGSGVVVGACVVVGSSVVVAGDKLCGISGQGVKGVACSRFMRIIR